MISCVVLAAGLSSRFGHPKALAKFGHQTLIDRLIEKLKGTTLFQIIVVLGAHAQVIEPCVLKHKGITVVYNKNYNLGQTSSFKAGLKAVTDQTSGIMLFPVDYPLIKQSTLETLISHFEKNSKNILIPVFQNKKGHPPIFPCDLISEFFKLEDSVGLNSVARQMPQRISLLEINDPGILTTFNTPEEFAKLKFQGQ